MTKRSQRLSVPRYRRVRRRRLWAGVAWGAVVLSALAGADQRWGLLAPRSAVDRLDGQRVRVIRVVDGDTLLIDRPDRGQPTTRVRVWGIDTPELARPGDYGRQAREAEYGAEQARDRAKQLTQGQAVTLTLEPYRTRGVYGRVLAHVTLPDGRSLAGVLLDEGWAKADGRWSHRHYSDYRERAWRARRDRLGIWDEPDQ